MTDFATAGGHWYRRDGKPAYTVVGANGVERPTTLRDARKHGYVPSVTGIIRMAAAPALEKWKRNQVLLAALTLPRVFSESESAWLARVERDWQVQGRDAADRGTAIHAAIEKHYRGEAPDVELWDWVKAVKEEIDSYCGVQEWSAERSFADPRGYGGKTDLHSPEWVIDAKGKEGDARATDLTLYDEHLMQLGAYREGLGIPEARCGILFFGRDVPSAILVEAKASELHKGVEMFSALLAFWQAKNNYRPA
jgi:hypothetical protein